MSNSNINLSISVDCANVYAISFFRSLIKEGLTSDDINLVHSFFTNLVTENYCLHTISKINE